MASGKRYYWLKLNENFFCDDGPIEWLEEQKNGKDYVLFYLKLCLKALKTKGILVREVGNMMIPYDAEKLAEITRTAFDTVTVAMELFKQIGLVQILESGEIYMAQLQEMVGSETTNAVTMRRMRAAKRLENLASNNGVTLLDECYESVVPDNRYIDTRYKNLDIRDIEKEKEEAPAVPEPSPLPAEKTNRIDYQQVVDLYNSVCVSLPKVKSLSEDRKKAIRARVNTYGMDKLKIAFEKANASSFLSGKNARNWTANFDWLIKDSSIAKVLDGNYDDKKAQATRQELVPEWCASPDEIANALRSTMKLRDELRTAGNDEEVRARAEALKKQLGGTS